MVVKTGKCLKNHGYDIKVFNTINFNKSAYYNPFSYIHSEKDILKLRGVRPFLSDKYDVTQHPHYKETGEYDKKNNYDIAGNLNPRMSLKDEDLYDVVEA
ncbi:hypothetical protein [Butyrivibrio sp. YAB3001]|uniref:hypothetical protein n=1 Tax=Butyrivibrio sp. YAB3001 TaxID=1520812 RepID=UPI0008F64BC1|nr:type IV secretion system protein VirD4 [Butyrivibrio sp. YAB3001]